MKTVFNNWNFDLSSIMGKNRIDYYIKNSFNQSFGAASPSDFYNGAHQFSNVVNNLDIVRTFENAGIYALTVVFGAEHRTERFVTEEGEFASYGTLPQTIPQTERVLNPLVVLNPKMLRMITIVILAFTRILRQILPKIS